MIDENDIDLIISKVVDRIATRIIEQTDTRYRKIEDCDKIVAGMEEKHETLEHRINENDVRFAEIQTKLKAILWVSGTIGAGVITTLISVIAGIIVK